MPPFCSAEVTEAPPVAQRTAKLVKGTGCYVTTSGGCLWRPLKFGIAEDSLAIMFCLKRTRTVGWGEFQVNVEQS